MNITHEQIIKAFIDNRTDKYHLHRYDTMYYTLFKECQPIKKLLEIGVKQGCSIGAWLDIFPEAEIVGVDITLENVIHEKAKKARLVEHDAVTPLVRDVITDVFDVIIDDGSHHPMDQWYSFLTFEGRWSQVYVIEDIIGKEHVYMIQKYLTRKNYNFKVFESAKKDAIYRIKGRDKSIAFYAIAIYPKI
jgi:hypothetical protein